MGSDTAEGSVSHLEPDLHDYALAVLDQNKGALFEASVLLKKVCCGRLLSRKATGSFCRPAPLRYLFLITKNFATSRPVLATLDLAPYLPGKV